MDGLRNAVWQHKVVIVKGQHKLDPKKQWDLVRQLDPETTDEGTSPNDRRNGLLTVKNTCMI
jgi:alpha-ketoglutarate-dependent taurine dioxygenase